MKKNKIINKAGKIIGEKAGDVFNELTNEARQKAIDTGAELIDDAAGKIKDIGKESIHTITRKVQSMVHKKGMPEKPDQQEVVVTENGVPGYEDVNLKNKDVPDYTDAKDVADHHDEEAIEDLSLDTEEEIYEIASDEADDKFADSITSDLLASGIKGIATPGEALSMIDDLVKTAGEVEKFREAQKTKRTAIEAEKDVAVKKLQAQKEILLIYLDKTFDERKQNFKKYFDVIDDALEKGNIQQLAMGLNSINELAQSSPFKDLADINQVGKALEDKNHEWDF